MLRQDAHTFSKSHIYFIMTFSRHLVLICYAYMIKADKQAVIYRILIVNGKNQVMALCSSILIIIMFKSRRYDH